jgi:hypothetical protein
MENIMEGICTRMRDRTSRLVHLAAACAIAAMHGDAAAAPDGNFGIPRWLWLQTLEQDPAPAFSSQFGTGVAIDGDLLVVGAPHLIVDGIDAGAAYVYRLVDGTWTLETTLTPDDPQHGGEFGGSVGVAVSAQREVIVVGESGRDDGASIDAGAVTIYEHEGADWHAVAQTTGGDQFVRLGYSVDTDGADVLVGAPATNGFRGATIMLRRDGSTGAWIVDHDTRPGAGDELAGYYGISVALNGDLTLTGAMVARVGGEGVGAAEIANAFADGPLPERIVLHAQEPAAADEFGRSVAADGPLFVVGAPGRDASASAPNSGSVYVFRRSESGLHLDELLASTFPQENAAFGSSVAVFGDAVVVGKPKRTVFLLGSEFAQAGAISLFGRSDYGIWELETPFYNLGTNEAFGEAVAIDGTRAIAAMPRHGSGAAWYVQRDTIFVDGFQDTAPE